MTRRALTTIGLAVAVLVVVSPSAVAAEGIGRQAWSPARPVSTFAPRPDRLYVAVAGGSEEARAFVELAGDAARAGGALLLAGPSGGLLPGNAAFAACPVTEALVAEGSLAAGPAADCSRSVPAEPVAEGTWQVDLTPFVERWAAGGPMGVALVPQIVGAADTWRLELDPARTRLIAAPAAAADVVRPEQLSPSSSLPPAPPSYVPPPAAASGADAPAAASGPAGVAPDDVGPTRVRRATALTDVPDASHPGILGALVLVVVLAGAMVAARSRGGLRLLAPTAAVTGDRRVGIALAGSLAALVLVGQAVGEVTLYKIGLVLIVGVAAIGLHVLVNWAGELSLAHAAFVGAPAFVVARFANQLDLSPVYLLPLGVVAGALLGALVGLPALRAKGLQVALVTLASYVAIDRFLFTKSWFVGAPGGDDIPTPRLAWIELGGIRALFLVLVACVGLAVAAAWLLWRSKVARSLLWMRSMPDAAAAFGIPVARYKVAAYATAGAFAGFAGGLTVVWVQRVTPSAFPFQLSFTYLVIVVLAGRGFLGGVAVTALALEGGRLLISGAGPLIAYGGPLGLLFTLTRYKSGLNGLGRQLMTSITQRSAGTARAEDAAGPDGTRWTAVGGLVCVVAGLLAIGFGWYHAGNTSQVWIQNQEMLSGGVGGLALVLIGIGLLIRDQLAVNQLRLAATVEQALHAIADDARRLREPADEANANGPAPRRRARAAARP